MGKHMGIRCMAVVAALVLAASLAACGGGGSDTAKKATTKTSSDSASSDDSGPSTKPKHDKVDTDTADTADSADTTDTFSTDDTDFTDTLDSSEPTMTDAAVDSDGLDADCTESLDHCLDRSQMQDYLDYTITYFVEPWIASHYTDLPQPAAYVYIGDDKTTSSACGTQDDQAYAYCPADNSVYVGQAFQWYLYRKFGAIGPAVAIAHEYGHHIQAVKNVPNPAEGTPEEVNNEDQADCVAGSWVFWADNQKLVQYPKDLENVAALMTAISDAESPNQTHGTSSQRTKSFSVGYGSDLQACNTFYPATPIVP